MTTSETRLCGEEFPDLMPVKKSEVEGKIRAHFTEVLGEVEVGCPALPFKRWGRMHFGQTNRGIVLNISISYSPKFFLPLDPR